MGEAVAPPQGAGVARDRRALWWALIGGTVLLVAHLVPPSRAGYGTHQRLLLPPCLFRELTGVPCPGCGLTTSVAEMARGRVRTAFRHHYLGPAAYLGAWGLLIWGLVAGAAGRAGPGRRLARRWVWGTLLAAYLGAWVVRLVVEHP